MEGQEENEEEERIQESQPEKDSVQETPDRNWLGQQSKITQLTTLSQSTLLVHNVSVCNLIHSESVDCTLPTQNDIQVQVNTELYESLTKETKSIGHLIAKTVHQVVTPIFLLNKTRQKMKGLIVQEHTITMKMHTSWR